MNNNYLSSVFYNIKYQEKIKSRLIKIKRKEMKISTNNLAFSLNVSQQYINDIEENRKKPSRELINEIFSELDIKFNEEIYVVNNIEIAFEKFLNQFLLDDISQSITIESIVNNDKCRFSYAFSLILICDYIHNFLNYKINKIDFEENKLYKHIIYFIKDMDPLHQSIFYLFRGLYFFKKNNQQKAKENYLKALEQTSTFSTDLIDGIKGVIYYNYAFLLARENKLHDAENLMNRSITYFKSMNYLNRLVYAENELALIYMHQHQFQRAELILKRSIRLIKQINRNEYWALIYYNIATLSFSERKYEKCITNSLKSLEYDNNCNSLYYYLSISYLKIGDKKNCKIYYDILNKLDLSNDEYSNKYKGLIYLYLKNESKSKLFKYLKDFYKYTIKHEIVSYQIDILQLLIEFCRENRKFRCLSEYQKILLDHYENT